VHFCGHIILSLTPCLFSVTSVVNPFSPGQIHEPA